MEYLNQAAEKKEAISLSADVLQDGSVSVWVRTAGCVAPEKLAVSQNSLSVIGVITNPHVPKLVMSAAEEEQLFAIFGVRLRGTVNLEALYRAIKYIDVVGSEEDAKERTDKKWRLLDRLKTETEIAPTSFSFSNEKNSSAQPFSFGTQSSPSIRWREKSLGQLPTGRVLSDTDYIQTIATEALQCIQSGSLAHSKRTPSTQTYLKVLENSFSSFTPCEGTPYNELSYLRKQKILLKVLDILISNGKIAVAN